MSAQIDEFGETMITLIERSTVAIEHGISARDVVRTLSDEWVMILVLAQDEFLMEHRELDADDHVFLALKDGEFYAALKRFFDACGIEAIRRNLTMPRSIEVRDGTTHVLTISNRHREE